MTLSPRALPRVDALHSLNPCSRLSAASTQVPSVLIERMFDRSQKLPRQGGPGEREASESEAPRPGLPQPTQPLSLPSGSSLGTAAANDDALWVGRSPLPLRHVNSAPSVVAPTYLPANHPTLAHPFNLHLPRNTRQMLLKALRSPSPSGKYVVSVRMRDLCSTTMMIGLIQMWMSDDPSFIDSSDSFSDSVVQTLWDLASKLRQHCR